MGSICQISQIYCGRQRPHFRQNRKVSCEGVRRDIGMPFSGATGDVKEIGQRATWACRRHRKIYPRALNNIAKAIAHFNRNLVGKRSVYNSALIVSTGNCQLSGNVGHIVDSDKFSRQRGRPRPHIYRPRDRICPNRHRNQPIGICRQHSRAFKRHIRPSHTPLG